MEKAIPKEFAEHILNSSSKAFMNRIKNEHIRKNFLITLVHENGSLSFMGRSDSIVLKGDLSAHSFDAYSYLLFKLGFLYVTSFNERNEVLNEIGENILRYIAERTDIPKVYDGFTTVKYGFDKILKYFVEMGYFSAAVVHLNGFSRNSHHFDPFDIEKWERGKESQFICEVHSPVIISGAMRLDKDLGLSYHYSSLTVRAFLRSLGIQGVHKILYEISEPPHSVVEHWWVSRCKDVC